MAQEDGYHFRVESNLRAGVAKADITRLPDTPVAGHVRPTSGVRDPICAGVLLLDNGDTRAAIVTLDLINAPSELVTRLREAIADGTKTPTKNILVATSHNLKWIPIIFISALTEPLDQVKAFAIGGVDYLTKPFQMEELQARVVTHLKKLRFSQEKRNFSRMDVLPHLK